METTYKILITVSEKELRDIIEGRATRLFRKSYPKNGAAYPLNIYLTTRGSNCILGKVTCSFIAPTIGSDEDLRKANMVREQFEKRFKLKEKFSIQEGGKWKPIWIYYLENPRDVDLPLASIVRVNSRKHTLTNVLSAPPDWYYVLDRSMYIV